MNSKTLFLLVAAIGLASSASAAMINLMPSKDNTLYEYVQVDGDRSNALGNYFFTGKIIKGQLRRGVLAFDIAGNIPPGSTITAVTLSLTMSRTLTDTPRTTELHKLLADWGEGTSQASEPEGQGAPATPNDATWRHRFYDMIFWTTQGGDFSATVSASQSVGPVGQYMWSSPQMVADVQSWLDNPASNFGWIVIGDEVTAGSAKRFDTRESASPPVLTIVYTEPTQSPTPTATATSTATASATATATATATAIATATATTTATATSTPTPTPSSTPTITVSPTGTPTATPTPSFTATITPTATPTATVTASTTPRATPTPRTTAAPRSRPTPPPHLTPVPPPPSPRPTAAPRPTPPPHITPVPTPSSPRPTPAPRP